MRLLLLMLLLSFWKPADAQRSYFLYLESEGGQPFYVKVEDRIISSTAPGYLILPEMADSTYELLIGFSSGRRAAKFAIPMEARDRGLLLQQDNGALQLSDLQTSRTVKAVPDPFSDISYTVRNDPFTVLLSRAAHDSDILYVPVAQPVVAKKDTPVTRPAVETVAVQQPATDSVRTETPPLALVQKDSAAVTAVDSSAIVRAPAELRPDTLVAPVSLVLDSTARPQTLDSASLAVREPAKLDTATIIDSAVVVAAGSRPDSLSLPLKPLTDSAALTRNDPPVADTVLVVTKPQVDTAASTPVEPLFQRTLVRKYAESSTSEGFGLVYIDQTPEGPDTIRLLIPNPPFNIGAPDTVKKDDPVLFMEVKKDTVQLKATPASLPLARPKADCPAQATDNDFFRLRKSMAGRTTDEDMIEDARKYFRKMCFTTEQVRNLSVLFLTAAGKYGFFDASYLHVSDQEQFASLESEIRDPYYAKRFKALVGE